MRLKCPGRLSPKPIAKGMTVDQVVDSSMFSFNAGSFRKACELFSEKMAGEGVRIGVSLAGALVPAGIGRSCLIPLIKSGLIDWLVATGANLYHDLHFALNYPVHCGSFQFDDTDLRDNDLVRIYDVVIPYSDGLMTTDELLRQLFAKPEF